MNQIAKVLNYRFMEYGIADGHMGYLKTIHNYDHLQYGHGQSEKK